MIIIIIILMMRIIMMIIFMRSNWGLSQLGLLTQLLRGSCIVDKWVLDCNVVKQTRRMKVY